MSHKSIQGNSCALFQFIRRQCAIFMAWCWDLYITHYTFLYGGFHHESHELSVLRMFEMHGYEITWWWVKHIQFSFYSKYFFIQNIYTITVKLFRAWYTAMGHTAKVWQHNENSYSEPPAAPVIILGKRGIWIDCDSIHRLQSSSECTAVSIQSHHITNSSLENNRPHKGRNGVSNGLPFILPIV